MKLTAQKASDIAVFLPACDFTNATSVEFYVWTEAEISVGAHWHDEMAVTPGQWTKVTIPVTSWETSDNIFKLRALAATWLSASQSLPAGTEIWISSVNVVYQTESSGLALTAAAKQSNAVIGTCAMTVLSRSLAQISLKDSGLDVSCNL